MVILWLAPEPPVAPLTGGRERARRMIVYLAARHTLHLLTYAAVTEDITGLPVASVHRVPYGSRRFGAAARRLIRRLRPDALITQQGVTIPSFEGHVILSAHDAVTAIPPRTDRLIAVKADDVTGVDIPVTILPNGVDLAYWSACDAPAEVHTLLFPAALHWPPNHEGAAAFLRQGWPLMQQRLVEAHLIIAGKQPRPELVALCERSPGVTLIPDPPDMRPLFARAAAILVPTLSPAGTRLKILQALAAGRPVVSTPAGAHGLALNDHILISEPWSGLVDAAVRALTDTALRSRLIENGCSLVRWYAWDHLLPVLDAAIES
ncbi:MAG: glycosyltransferase [Chloroflexi bacterium]|nr:glycosyltransferase [Chloroflexota bacterium]